MEVYYYAKKVLSRTGFGGRMKFYLAPMESMTGYVFRNVYHKYFHNVDKYFTPFITSTGLSHKELNDILPEHNEGMLVVPQILTNKVEDFLTIAGKLQNFGYETVNLNLGCPSGTVVAKKRGAGQLADTMELDRFLDGIFSKCPVKISVKTRIGMQDETEWDALQEIFNKYPFEEIIVHPRLQQDFYKNPVHYDVFDKAFHSLKAPVCYNGDIHSVEHYNLFVSRFPAVDTIMLGRGIFMNPGLVDEICAGRKGVSKDTLRAFHDEILEGYIKIMSGDKNTLYKMKEIWVYLGTYFENRDDIDSERVLKKIRKANSIAEYKMLVRSLFI